MIDQPCLLGWDHVDDVKGMVSMVLNCINCQMENCPVKAALLRLPPFEDLKDGLEKAGYLRIKYEVEILQEIKH